MLELWSGGFDWDDGNRRKCQKHGVSPAEIEAVFDRKPFYLPDAAHSRDEDRFFAVAIASLPRPVFVVFTPRTSAAGYWSGQSARAICISRRSKLMLKPFPRFASDEEAEDFVATADLTEYDWSTLRRIAFVPATGLSIFENSVADRSGSAGGDAFSMSGVDSVDPSVQAVGEEALAKP